MEEHFNRYLVSGTKKGIRIRFNPFSPESGSLAARISNQNISRKKNGNLINLVLKRMV